VCPAIKLSSGIAVIENFLSTFLPPLPSHTLIPFTSPRDQNEMGKKRASSGADIEKNPLGDAKLSDAQEDELKRISDESRRVDIALGTRRLSPRHRIASNTGLGSDRVPYAGETCCFPGEATTDFEGHPKLLACCFVEPPHCRDARCAPRRPGCSELPRGRLVDQGPQGEEMLHFGVCALF
jgi:hypothetical protein